MEILSKNIDNSTSIPFLSLDDTIHSLLRPKEGEEGNPPKISLDLYACRVEAGFPSPADDFLETSLDLNEHLIQHPAATFFVRVNGDSMIGVGIHHQDILVVDRSLEPKHGSVIIAVLNGELTVKTLEYRSGKPFLVPANPAYDPVAITDEMEFSVWGVVTSVVHQFGA